MFGFFHVVYRDEFLRRPTAAASWRDDLLGGWDLEEGRQGGTWLAADRRGRVAFLTNIYTGGAMDKKARGRGHLVVDYLRGETPAAAYLAALAADASFYNPFNMVLLEPDQAGKQVMQSKFSTLFYIKNSRQLSVQKNSSLLF